ncbi:MAG: amidohydrolase family protein [Candidatus Aminicenantales bacterium]
MEDCIRLFSTNVAFFYKLSNKDEIKPGKDADLILVDKDLELRDVFSRGRRMMADGKLLAKSTFSAPR